MSEPSMLSPKACGTSRLHDFAKAGDPAGAELIFRKMERRRQSIPVKVTYELQSILLKEGLYRGLYRGLL